MKQQQQQHRHRTDDDEVTTDAPQGDARGQQASEDAACCLVDVDAALADSDQAILDEGYNIGDLYAEYDRRAGHDPDTGLARTDMTDEERAAAYADAEAWWNEEGRAEAERRRDRFAAAYERVHGIAWNPCVCG